MKRTTSSFSRSTGPSRGLGGSRGPGGPGGPRGPRGPRGAAQQRKPRRCRFCDSKEYFIDYKNEKRLARFISEQGRIIPRRISGTCQKHQRILVVALKRARHIGLLPFVADAVS
ncbi:MAG: 30S ribosomal protein S18 [Ignavibacteriae bacterium]|nr:30S ribosomal protein S18 [Ignavibacteriota bacterium]